MKALCPSVVECQGQEAAVGGGVGRHHNREKNACRAHGEAGELAQQLKALTALPEVLSSIPSNHMVAHNHL